MNKKKRQLVYEKFGGLCAYSGKPLDDKWQVDHVRPLSHWHWKQPETIGKEHDLDNLLPAIRIVNHYKRCRDIDAFRKFLSTLHERLKKLPKSTFVARSIRHKEYLLEVASLFDITIDKPFCGTFYYERIQNSEP